MKFSTIEKQIIKDLCKWAHTPNEFQPTRNFFKQNGLDAGTGLFSFSKEIENRPPIILCIDNDVHKPDEFEHIYSQTLFRLFFLRKLESLGLITISEGRYSNEDEFAIGTFADANIIGVRKVSEPPHWCYSFTYIKRGHSACELELVENGFTIRYRENQVALPFTCMEIFTRFDSFELVASNIALEQELFDLVGKDFKTNEEIMLETANRQLETAYKIIENAEIQTAKAIESINQSKVQFEVAQNNSNQQFKKATRKSIIALVLAVISIILTPFIAIFVPTTINKEQYLHTDSIRTEELFLINELKKQHEKPDTNLINLSNKLDSILKTMKYLKVNGEKK